MCQGIVNNAGMDNPDMNGIYKSDCGTGEYRALYRDNVVTLDDEDDGSHSIVLQPCSFSWEKILKYKYILH